MLQRFNMPTHTIPMLSKKPKAATADLHKALLGTRNPGLGYMAKRAQPVLYDADTLLHPTHHPVSIWDSEEVLVHQVESEKNYDLDEDDYELLEDNGFRFSKVESKKFKRLKKGKADDDRCPPTDGIVEDEQPEEEEDGDTGKYEDEMANFFVNEEHMDEHGQPKRFVARVDTLADTWILPLPYAQNIDANRGVRRHHTVDRTSIFVAEHGQPDSACDEGCHLSFVASAKLISLAALKL
ncbi:transcription elongation factor SPT6 [Tanacetum coccineum]